MLELVRCQKDWEITKKQKKKDISVQQKWLHGRKNTENQMGNT